MRAWALPLLIALLFAAPTAQAFASGTDVLDENRRFANGLDDTLHVISGKVVADINIKQEDHFGFYQLLSGVSLSGLEKVCFTGNAGRECLTSTGGQAIEIRVPTGSSFGMFLLEGGTATAHVEASHGLTTFVDLSRQSGFDPACRPGKSFISAMVDGSIQVSFSGRVGKFAVTEAGASAQIVVGGTVIHTVGEGDTPVEVEGTLNLGEINAHLALLPFGSTATFSKSTTSAADAGLGGDNFARLQSIANGLSFVEPDERRFRASLIDKFSTVITETMNGAIITLEAGRPFDSLGEASFTRFDDLTVSSVEDSQGNTESTQWEGDTTLVVEDGKAQRDSAALYIGNFPIPWWTIVLVEAAILIGAVRLIFGPSRDDKTLPQNWKWTLAGVNVLLIVASIIMWDFEIRDVVGTSIFSTDASGQEWLAVFGMEVLIVITSLLLIGLPVAFFAYYALQLYPDVKSVQIPTSIGVLASFALSIPVIPAILAFWLIVFG